MAPEQIQHEMHHVCGATDLYSLGCILYKLLSGHAPFTGDAKELLRLHEILRFDQGVFCQQPGGEQQECQPQQR